MKNDCCSNHSLVLPSFIRCASFAKLFTIKTSFIRAKACNSKPVYSHKEDGSCNTGTATSIYQFLPAGNVLHTRIGKLPSYTKETGVCTGEVNINSNEVDISSNKLDISSNEVDIDTQKPDIDSNEAGISSNEIAARSFQMHIDIGKNTIVQSPNGHVHTLEYGLTVVRIPPYNAEVSADSAVISVDIRMNPILHFANGHRQSCKCDLTVVKMRATVTKLASTSMFSIPPSYKYGTTCLKRQTTVNAADSMLNTTSSTIKNHATTT